MKRLFPSFALILLTAAVCLAAAFFPCRDTAEPPPAVFVPVLLYHALAQELPDDPYNLFVTPGRFDEHIQALLDAGYTFISFGELWDFHANGEPLPDKPVIMTFDDGYIDNYTLAWPIIKRYGIKAAIFLADATIGDGEHLTWEQMREMEATGLVEIYSHGLVHHDYAALPIDIAVAEVLEAYENILRNLGRLRTIAFAYPYGSSSDELRAALLDAGFDMQVLTGGGLFDAVNGDYTAINRLQCKQGMSGEELVAVATNSMEN